MANRSTTGTVYISDLDGTLLRDDATLSAYSRDALRSMLREGLAFTVASARSVASMQIMLQGLDLGLPVVEFNGAFLSDLKTGRHEFVHALEPPVAEDVYRLSVEAGHAPFVSTFNGSEDRLYYRDVTNDGMRWYLEDRQKNNDPRLRAAEDLKHVLRDRVVCLTLIGKSGPLTELQTAIGERHAGRVQTYLFANDYSPGWHWLTVHDRRATKDQAIRTLLEQYGLDKRELVVFGDGLNDLGMFGIADRSVAVANAFDALKDRATAIIGSNEEDSVARYIQSEWRSGFPPPLLNT